MSQDPPKPLSHSPFLRLLVLSPLLLSSAAALLLAAMAPFAWGAADEFGIAAWVPTASALLLALPVLLVGAWAIRALWSRMTGLFDVDMFGATIGGGTHWVASICLVTFAGTIGSSNSYRSLVDEGTSTAGFVFLVTLASMIGAVLLAGLTMVYVWAVTAGPTTRVAQRREDEVDFVEQWGRREERP